MNESLTQAEKLVRDLDTLADSIRIDWADLSKLHVSIQDRSRIRKGLASCLTEIGWLLDRLERPN